MYLFGLFHWVLNWGILLGKFGISQFLKAVVFLYCSVFLKGFFGFFFCPVLLIWYAGELQNKSLTIIFILKFCIKIRDNFWDQFLRNCHLVLNSNFCIQKGENIKGSNIKSKDSNSKSTLEKVRYQINLNFLQKRNTTVFSLKLSYIQDFTNLVSSLGKRILENLTANTFNVWFMLFLSRS